MENIQNSTTTTYWAHSGGHELATHLTAVAKMAAEFSKPFEPSNANQRWAYMAGLWHDLGKYREGFQRYVIYENKSSWRSRVQ